MSGILQASGFYNRSMVLFKSLITFDLETTALLKPRERMPKVTELAMAACLVSHCQEARLPRIINKFVFAVNPETKLESGAAVVSGLDNSLLDDLRPFDSELVMMLTSFLGRLPKPICLIAHNGNRFDFKILSAELKTCSEKLQEDLYYADSYAAFKDILPKQEGLLSYKLKDIYSFLHGGNFSQLHTAEGDCMALLSCIMKCKNEFLHWLSENAKQGTL